jgi:hypothetical protein
LTRSGLLKAGSVGGKSGVLEYLDIVEAALYRPAREVRSIVNDVRHETSGRFLPWVPVFLGAA